MTLILREKAATILMVGEFCQPWKKDFSVDFFLSARRRRHESSRQHSTSAYTSFNERVTEQLESSSLLTRNDVSYEFGGRILVPYGSAVLVRHELEYSPDPSWKLLLRTWT